MNQEQVIVMNIMANEQEQSAYRELSMEEVLSVAGGPQVTNDGAIPPQ